MLPIEATSLLGSLAGIGEIAKATFGESAASAAPPRAAARCHRRPTAPRRPPPALTHREGCKELAMTRDVRHAGHLELADLRRRADGAGTARARRVPVLARPCRIAGRADLLRRRSVVADADPDVRGVCARGGAALAAPGARRARRRARTTRFSTAAREALVGRVFTLEKPIVDGVGTVRIDDTVWRVAGPDTPAGTRVRVVEAKGANLTVAAA